MNNNFVRTNAILCIFFIIVTFTACNTSKENKKAQEPIKQNAGYVSPIPDPILVSQITPIPTQIPTPVPTPETPVNEKIAAFSTKLIDRSWARMRNIKLACREINGFIVQPGEVFSFNKVVGKRTAGKGYKKAIVFIKDKREKEEGGGICQVSSTLYVLVQKAGLEVVERHPHTQEVDYVPQGQDAAVSYGSIDFKFKNTKKYPIKVEAYVMNNQVITSIIKME